MDPDIVIQTIWSRSRGAFVFTPMAQDGAWYEMNAIDPLQYQVPGPEISSKQDLYFSPLKFTSRHRRKGGLSLPGVIYADLDGNHDPDPRLAPSVIITTSKGHAHGYWFLEEPVKPVDWETRAKGWSQEINADPGGWDATQVLRVPGTINHKYGTPVSVTSFNPQRVYALDQFPEADVHTGGFTSLPPVPSKELRDVLIEHGMTWKLPLSARYWLTASPAEIKALGTIDRSKIMWQLEKNLLSAGYDPTEVFQLMFYSPINKWTGRPDRLWYEINKAAATT